MLKSAKVKDAFFVPGEHDVLNDDGKQYRERYGKDTQGAGWYSFDKNGVHFVGLVNVMNLKAGGSGEPGQRATRVDGKGREASLEEHADRCVCAHSAVDRLSGVGLGHGRQRTGARVPEEIRLGDGAEWAHPPDHAEGRRQRDVSHSDVDGVSAAEAGEAPSPGPMKVPEEQLALGLGNHGRELRAREACAGGDGRRR